MALDDEDPRERPWHPRFASSVVGHDAALAKFEPAVASGKPHHAWLITGPKGIGKATFAYTLARQLLTTKNPAQTIAWISARSHPQLFVLERSLNDSKPKRLKAEISVEDARRMGAFFGRTAGDDGWRVAIIDAVDDLNSESANALLKLVEEPPPKCLLLLVCHQPGRTLRTLRSRCLNLPLQPLSDENTINVLHGIPLEPKPSDTQIESAAHLSHGRPGHAMELLNSQGAKAFEAFLATKRHSPSDHLAIASHFSGRQQASGDFEIFADLLLDWIAREAASNSNASKAQTLAETHTQFATRRRTVEGYNLDRRVAVLDILQQLN